MTRRRSDRDKLREDVSGTAFRLLQEPSPLFTADGMAGGRWARAIRRSAAAERPEPA